MRRLSPWLTALLQTVILLTVVACATPWLNAEENPPSLPRRSDDIVLRGHKARPVFNGSVVAGGVYSLDELRTVIGRDPVVAAHYRGIDFDRMEVVTLTAGKAAYVSYRRGDAVHWTRDRVWLKPGETVLTDGTTMIRARCGNCVSDVRQENVAAVDPAHGELDDFVVPPTPDTGVDAFAADAEEQIGELMRVPFASSALAWLSPGVPLLVPGLLDDDPVAPSPFDAVLPLLSPGGHGGDIEDGGNPDDRPQPPALVPDVPGASSGNIERETASTGARPAPEPEILWLIVCGVAGLAGRRFRLKP
jgi:hypothetical protein